MKTFKNYLKLFEYVNYKLSSGEPVKINWYHVHKDVKQLLPEVFSKIEGGENFIEKTIEFDHNIGYTHCVTTTDDDEIYFDYRTKRRDKTRFVKNREPELSNKLTIILLKKASGIYQMLTAFIGAKAEPEVWDERAFKRSGDYEKAKQDALNFWKNHALIPESMKYLKLFEAFNFHKEDFPYGLNNIPDNVVLYRVFGLEDDEEIDYDNLGLHYVGDENLLDDENFLLDIGFTEDELDTLTFQVVKIKTTRDNIDIEETIKNRLQSSEEYEYTIKNENNIEVLNKPDEIYHYTSFENALKILESGQLKTNGGSISFTEDDDYEDSKATDIPKDVKFVFNRNMLEKDFNLEPYDYDEEKLNQYGDIDDLSYANETWFGEENEFRIYKNINITDYILSIQKVEGENSNLESKIKKLCDKKNIKNEI